MKILQCQNEEDLDKTLFQLFLDHLPIEPSPSSTSIALASGKTFLNFYKTLSHQSAPLARLSKFHFFQLDDYLDLNWNSPEAYPKSFCSYFETHLFFKGAIPRSQFFPIFNKNPIQLSSPEKESLLQSYESLWKSHPPEICLLGLGLNGHIAFNEPHSPSLKSNHFFETVVLSQKTIQTNFSNEEPGFTPPSLAFTATPKAICSSKHLILVIKGDSKKEVLEKILNSNKKDPELPATYLLDHPSLFILST